MSAPPAAGRLRPRCPRLAQSSSLVAACVIVASSPSTCRHLGAPQNAELMELPVLSNLAWTRSPGTRSRQAHIHGEFCSPSLEMDRWTHEYLMGS